MLKKQYEVCLHDKGVGELKDTRDVSKQNKSNIIEAKSQHQIIWREK